MRRFRFATSTFQPKPKSLLLLVRLLRLFLGGASERGDGVVERLERDGPPLLARVGGAGGRRASEPRTWISLGMPDVMAG